ncbi:MAG: hypothetical protein ABH951_02655 [Patescibacteria group bacterium]
MKNNRALSPVVEKENLNSINLLTDQDEVSLVEKYIKDNIKNIATNSTVMGGSWYVVSIFVLSEIKSGVVVYEDGHIQSEAFFEYEFDFNTKNITIKKFEVK